jgi:Xaa-Pro aminopeptidase
MLPQYSLQDTLRQRRQRLARLVPTPVILWSGRAPSRNFPANRYPFRSSSHFLYFAGLALENAAIRLEDDRLELFMDDASAASALWHGETPTRDKIAAKIGANAAYPLSKLALRTEDAATVAVQDAATYREQCQLLGRAIQAAECDAPGQGFRQRDLACAIVSLRLCHDKAAIAEMRQAAEVAIAAHLTGMKTVSRAKTEAEVRGAMEGAIFACNMQCAYNSIVTVQGEVLHNEQYCHSLQAGDLLLADVGAETPNGWASDLTRTFPVSGRFSTTQRDLYEVVLKAHDTCIERMRPGVEYREIHLLAALVIAEGLVDLGILRGKPQDLVDMDAHALFFPHGVGHLLGLDVHDMEDLGDLAGYEEGRTRSDRFGLSYLRLDRPLRAGMVVTVEPGFYQVPAILNSVEFRNKYREVVNWERLEMFKDVKGIRIEDDVLITELGTEVLTAKLPKVSEEIEALTRY